MIQNHLPVWAQILMEDHAPGKGQGSDSRDQRREDSRNGNVHRAIDASITSSRVESGEGCLVLMAHGSRDARWRGTFECLFASVRSRFTDDIRLAYMEFVGPTLMDVARGCFRDGVRAMRVLPLFMAGGAHVATDIPEQMAQVREAFPTMTIEAMAPIGEDPRMFAVIQEIIGEHARSTRSRLSAA